MVFWNVIALHGARELITTCKVSALVYRSEFVRNSLYSGNYVFNLAILIKVDHHSNYMLKLVWHLLDCL